MPEERLGLRTGPLFLIRKFNAVFGARAAGMMYAGIYGP
jgi:hypothetical protein